MRLLPDRLKKINKILLAFKLDEVKKMKEVFASKEDFIRDYRLKIGDAIREIREKKGYSQHDLADIMDISRSTLSKIENGKFAITIDYLAKLSFHLNFHFELKNNVVKRGK